jgi:hypothetical protein
MRPPRTVYFACISRGIFDTMSVHYQARSAVRWIQESAADTSIIVTATVRARWNPRSRILRLPQAVRDDMDHPFCSRTAADAGHHFLRVLCDGQHVKL